MYVQDLMVRLKLDHISENNNLDLFECWYFLSVR